MFNGPQQPGPIRGANPLIYTGSTPNMVTMNRRPTPTDGASWPIGMWWIIPIDTTFITGEVWTLVSKANGIFTWKKLDNTVPPDTNTGLIWLQTVSTNNSAVPFLALSGNYLSQYHSYQINLNNIAPSGGTNCQLNMYVSADGGNTFITGVGGGLTAFNCSTGAITAVPGTGSGNMPVILSKTTVFSGGGSGTIYLSFGQNLPPNNRLPHISGHSFGSDATGDCSSSFGGLWLNAGSQINYIKFVWESSSANIIDGRISIYAYTENGQ